MARTWSRWPGRASIVLLLCLLASVSPGRADPRAPFSARAIGPDVSTAVSDLRPTYTLRGYSPADHFSGPEGIAIDARNRILYVADTGKGRVVGFSLQGLPKFVITVPGVSAPRDLAVDGAGHLYVADKEAPTIVSVDAQGKALQTIDLTAAGTTGPPRIRGLVVDHQGRLYIGDQAAAQVLVCDRQGNVLTRIGSPGEERGQLKMVEDVALDRVGRIYVVDSVATPVNVFDQRGKFIFRFGRISTDDQDLRGPTGLWIDRHDQLWVVDQEGHGLFVFDGRGFLLRRFGGEAAGAAPMFLFPSTAILDELGNLYVVEKGADQVRVFALSNPFSPFRL
jgi:DNA-binding beta-propeller fold protein YncE